MMYELTLYCTWLALLWPRSETEQFFLPAAAAVSRLSQLAPKFSQDQANSKMGAGVSSEQFTAVKELYEAKKAEGTW